MKTRNIWAALIAASTIAFYGCSEVKFTAPSADGLPLADNYKDLITTYVDQSTNQVHFQLDAKGVMPVWIIDGKTYSTVNGLTKLYAVAGTYEYEMKVLNANGISDGSVKCSFTVNNTIYDFDKYLSFLAGDGTRQWRIDNKAAGHLGCGPSGTTGTEWWSAGADEKAGTGLYDNRLKYDKQYNYYFDPGEAGTIYVNKDVTKYPDYRDPDLDYNVPASAQQTTFDFEVVGPDLFLLLPKGTNFPYIANDDLYENPRYRIESINPNSMELVSDNGSIAWHYTFTSKADDTPKPFTGFKYDSDFNLWKKCNISNTAYYYAPGWSQIADPATTISDDKSTITVSLPAATTDQWQAQMLMTTDMSATEALHYDFSVILNSTTDHPGVTVKLTDATDDGNFFFAERVPLKAYEDNVFWRSDMPGINAANLKMVFDFGGCAEGTEITIKNIVYKDHANDDGTILPVDPEPEPGKVIWADVNSPDNLMTSGTVSLASCWWADDNWSQVADPAVDINGRNITVTANSPSGGSQWQGQVHVNTGVPVIEGLAYDLRVVLNPTQDLGGATVKPHPEGDDNHFFSQDRHDLIGWSDNAVEITNVVADFSCDNLVFTFDFPGCEAGTVIEIKDIIVQFHNEGGGGGTKWVDVNDPANLMTAGSFGLASCWWADNGWSQVADPAVEVNGRNAVITANAPSGGNQWQGQVHFNTGVTIEEGVTYDFRIVLNPAQDLGGATVKPHPEGDDNHFFSQDRHDLAGWSDNAVEIVGFTSDFATSNLVITLDFPGCEAGTVIEVKDIIIQVH